MPIKVLPLAGEEATPNERNYDSLQSLISGQDKRLSSAIVVPISNPITQQKTVYIEKRPGFETVATPASGCAGQSVFFSATTGEIVSAFCGNQLYVSNPSTGTSTSAGTVTANPPPSTRLVVVSDNGNAYLSDDGGVTFSTVTLGFGWDTVAVGNGIVSAVHTLSNACHASYDHGATWLSGTMPKNGASTGYARIKYSSELGKFICLARASGTDQPKLATSVNGLNDWVLASGGIGGFISERSVAYHSSRFVATYAGGAKYSDTNGGSWVATSGLGSRTWNDIVWFPAASLWVTVAQEGFAAWSTTGTSWTEVAGPAIAAARGKLEVGTDRLMCFNGSQVWVTLDGKNWTSYSIGGAIPWQSPSFNGSTWFAGSYAQNKTSVTSSDGGQTWTTRTNQPTTNFNDSDAFDGTV